MKWLHSARNEPQTPTAVVSPRSRVASSNASIEGRCPQAGFRGRRYHSCKSIAERSARRWNTGTQAGASFFLDIDLVH